ncbi:hypothetical protein CENSYa_1296 [Cenarchaeum symbiosum A]|uniref:Uncharacterized protein n=1 Tax=Cenarchaeum symbiosum (strain A) TaxID=414004 RepID=A0RX52_CENSY|nr:hypothetical protein CENSYa_1296 [Cenarchaeum symbiosum A]
MAPGHHDLTTTVRSRGVSHRMNKDNYCLITFVFISGESRLRSAQACPLCVNNAWIFRPDGAKSAPAGQR